MLRDELKELLFKLNKEQLEAVHHQDNPCLVIAGAGSGKTQVLTLRVARLISTGIAPENIMVVTYTREAKKNMLDRLKPLIGEELCKRLYIGTFHSICLRLLKEKQYRKNIVPMATWKKEAYIKEIIEKLELKKVKVEAVSEWIGKQKNSLRTWNCNFNKYYDLESESYLKKYIKIYREYETKKRETGEIDFDDMVLLVHNMLEERDDIRWQYSQQFKHICVDEAQDSSKALLDIMKILTEIHNNIFMVGDLRQSIYGFANAKIENLLNFEKEWDNSRVIFLKYNYRSNKSIVELGNVLTNFNRHPYMIGNAIAHNTSEREPIIKTCEDEYCEADYIANEIKRLRSIGIKYKDIAIIYRVNSQSCAIEAMLKAYNIPYNILGGNEFFELQEVQDIVYYLQVAINPNDNKALKKIFNKPYRGFSESFVEEVGSYARSRGMSLYQALQCTEQITKNFKWLTESKKLYKLISKLNNFVKLYNDDVSRVVEEIIYETGYYKAVQERHGCEDKEIDSFEALIQLGEKFRTPFTFLSYCLKGVKEAESSNNRGNKVQLMTGHKAKGMEFKATFCIGLAHDLLPYKKNIEDKKLFAEERRICYVNITRAEEYLYVTYPKNYKNKEKIVSPFLEEMLGDYKLKNVLGVVYSKSKDIEEVFNEKVSNEGEQVSLFG